MVGAEDGTFPPIGWHITGQMGGVWAPPVKLLDGLWFLVQGSWLDSATSCTSGPGFARMSFPVTNGLRPTLTEFAPDGSPVVLFGLTLVPASAAATTVHVVGDAHGQVDAAYPWTSTTPTWDSCNHPDAASASNGILQFQQQQTPWYAEVGASPQPASISTGAGDWGPTPADQQTAFGSKGQGGELSGNLPVPAGGRALWLGVAGSQNGSQPALSALKSGLSDPLQLLNGKIAQRDSVAGQTQVQVPDSSVQQAVLWSKLNLADLRRTITGINETAQFAIAAGQVWRWSGDSTFLRQNYQFVKEGEQYLASLATGPGHLWPVGDGIVENPALEGDCTHAGEQLQQRWWTSVAPMEQDVAPAGNADSALTTMEGPTSTGSCGLYVDGVGGPSGTGGQTCYLVNTGAMAVGEANLRPPGPVHLLHGQGGQPAHRRDARLPARAGGERPVQPVSRRSPAGRT